MRQNPALEAALALAANPLLAEAMRRRPLPGGVPELLRILSDGSGKHGRRLSDAAAFYVQAVMLFPGAPPRRVLGVGADASREEMRANLRLLMQWLHPDLNNAAWRSAFARRVLEAWRAASAGADTQAATHHRQEARRTRRRRGRVPWVRTPIEAPQQRRRTMAKLALLLALGVVALTFPTNVVRDERGVMASSDAAREAAPVALSEPQAGDP